MAVTKSIISKFKEGDSEAIGLVFEEYKNLLYFIIASYVSNSDDCDDLLSEVFLKALEHKNELKDVKNVKSYLSSIAKNEALQFLKKRKMIVIDNIDQMYGDNDNLNPILDMFGPLLTNKETIIIYYRIVFSYSWKEIVEETKIPESTAKLIYSNAKKKMRKMFL